VQGRDSATWLDRCNRHRRVTTDQRLAYLEQTLANLVRRVFALEHGHVMPVPVAPFPQAPPPPRDDASLEHKLGSYWLGRVGIVSLITGAALLISTYFGALPPAARVALGYAMAAAIAWAGLALAKRHATFGRVVFGGGIAIGYFTTYALHFVPALRVIDDEAVGVALVAVAITAIVAIAHRMKSETVAGVALYLALHTGILGDVPSLSLACATLLAAGACFFVIANRWVIVPLSAVVAVYATHGAVAFGDKVEPEVTIAFIAIGFVPFALAVLIRPDARVAVPLAILNAFGAVVLGACVLDQGGAFPYLVAAALVHALLAAIAHVRRAPAQLVATLLALALASAAVAAPLELTDAPLVAAWIALALACGAVARVRWAAFAWGAIALVAAAQLDAYLGLQGIAARTTIAAAWFAIDRLLARSRGPAYDLAIAGVAFAVWQLATAAFPADLDVIAGVVAALAMFAAGFATRIATYRWAAFATLAWTAIHCFALRLDVMSAGQRVATFGIAGVVLLGVSFAYTRRKS
jgi:hypothetical protein